MNITKQKLKQIIKEELRESVINKEYDEPMTAGQILMSLQHAVSAYSSGPRMANALRDIADQIDRSHASELHAAAENIADIKFADMMQNKE